METHTKQKHILFGQEVVKHILEADNGYVEFQFSASEQASVLITSASGKAIAALDRAGFRTQVFEKGVRVYPKKDENINNG